MPPSSSSGPPRLPKLPPLRESAEQALPPAPEAHDDAADGTAPPPSRRERAPRADRPLSAHRERQPDAGLRAPAGGGGAGGGAREGRAALTEDGRRLSTAGHGVVVGALALAFGALLLAPGMHKAAYNGEQGTKREVVLALTDGLRHVSHALFLDRPRAFVQDAIGREGADEIDVAIVAPEPGPTTTPSAQTTPASTTQPPTAKPATPAATKPAKPAFTPKKKLRIWIAGDSLVITPGYAILRAAGGSPVMQSVGGVEGRVATGLTRPDVFNWFQEITAKVKELKPHVVVLGFGGNDDKAYMTGLPDGATLGDFGSPAWSAEYLRRVRVVMDTINKAGGTVVWIGLPITNNEAQSRRYDTVNAVVQREAKRRGPAKALYVDTYTMFAGQDGGFTQYLENARGDSVKVRAGDGVHFDVAGGDMIAREVVKHLNDVYDLTSWRTKAQPNS